MYKLKLRILTIQKTPLETVDEFSFLGVNNTLNELHIINSSLLEFPTAAFKVRHNNTYRVQNTKTRLDICKCLQPVLIIASISTILVVFERITPNKFQSFGVSNFGV